MSGRYCDASCARMPSSIALPDGVHFLQRGWLSSNNILLVDKSQAILIDTGYYTHAQQTLDLVKHQLSGQPLTTIINTHLHSDHCGGNAFLQSAFPDVTTWIPPGHAPYVRNWDPLLLGYVGTGQHCPPFKVNNSLSTRRPSRSSTSMRQWPWLTTSPSCGKSPVMAMTKPAECQSTAMVTQ